MTATYQGNTQLDFIFEDYSSPLLEMLSIQENEIVNNHSFFDYENILRKRGIFETWLTVLTDTYQSGNEHEQELYCRLCDRYMLLKSWKTTDDHIYLC